MNSGIVKMKKNICFAAAMVAGFSFASAAMAQSVLYFDARDNAGANQLINAATAPYLNGDNAGGATNAGGKGDGQVLRISPTDGDGMETISGGTSFPNYDGDGDASTGGLWLYMDVADDASGTGDVITSLGLDINLSGAANGSIDSIDFQLFNDASVGAASATPWNDKVDGASDVNDPPSWAGAKAVRVPVAAGPVFDASLGLTPGTEYRVGRLDAAAAVRSCAFGGTHVSDRTYEVRLAVNNLLITRGFETGGDAVEDVQFGYDSGAPDAEVLSGSTDGATSTTADALIVVQLKCDASRDGRVLNNDLAGFFAARAVGGVFGNTVEEDYLWDFSGDRRVLNNDLAGFFTSRTQSATCP
jgi:hypothetical protein